MDIRGYETGPIAAEAAFTSDFALPRDLPAARIVDLVETDRPAMDVRPGMRHKYLPLRFDPATAAPQVGGRYLFDTWPNVLAYDHFTTHELEFEPGVKFWDRPFFHGVVRHLWHVLGAHDFTPLATTHHVNRFERWTYRGPEAALRRAWPRIREAAAAAGLASAWLLFQPDQHQTALVTVRAKTPGTDPADTAARSISALELLPSLGRFLPDDLAKAFDRTSLILAQWLPRSRTLGGAASAHPWTPLYPAPSVVQPA
ncbi:hypothetical protein VSH64_17935 [Amycolatopsis rhabdoformis]|uniref:Uncharacterized protein n=1 Tax=Amycolatopsis rhabdoformis TaxID=1448059 RepID=A0ABZ1IHN7_9PSEU|nr:hypothetical protein [Amycolatopsis rhabdoformis]WSE33959.1 hypothetical protein VSH64_17935 [Amycolatopsis rhabdoformis]